MVAVVLVISYASGIAALLHAYRTPESRWVAADRQRGWWLPTIAVLTVLGAGLLIAVPYAIGVLPRLASARNSAFPKS